MNGEETIKQSSNFVTAISCLSKLITSMNKQQFLERLVCAGEAALTFASSYVLEQLPVDLCYSIGRYDDPHGRRGPSGTIKFLGGRFLQPSSLSQLTALQAATLLWIDGKVPAWINIGVVACLETKTELFLRFSRTLVHDDEDELPPNIECLNNKSLFPFRIRGPGSPLGWRSVELDGRVSLIPKRNPDGS